MLPGISPERSVLYGRPNRRAETLRFAVHDPERWMPVFRQDHAPLAGVTRAGKTNDCPRTASTSRAGHDAGRMMPNAARVRRGRTLRPRAPHPLPPAVRLRLASLHEERVDVLLVLVARIVKIVVNIETMYWFFKTFRRGACVQKKRGCDGRNLDSRKWVSSSAVAARWPKSLPPTLDRKRSPPCSDNALESRTCGLITRCSRWMTSYGRP
jgi:hypothetical protein